MCMFSAHFEILDCVLYVVPAAPLQELLVHAVIKAHIDRSYIVDLIMSPVKIHDRETTVGDDDHIQLLLELQILL